MRPPPPRPSLTDSNSQVEKGMTKREEFVKAAMQALLSSNNATIAFYKNDSGAKDIAQAAIAHADAVLELLEG